MNRILLSLLFVVCGITMSYAQVVPNPGFEQWNEFELYDEPESYFTTNNNSYLFGGAPGITRAPGQQFGNTALRMEVDASVFLGFQPIVYALDLNDPTRGGVPFTGQPDSLEGFFNYQLSVDDTFSLALIFKTQGTIVGFQQLDITGSSNGQFERIVIPVSPLPIPPDTVGVVMGIGVLSGTASIGDFVEIDELNFINSTDQLPNHQFEDWNTLSFEEPENWTSINLISVLSGNSKVSVQKSTDAYEGNYAARVESVAFEFFGQADTAGILAISDLSGNSGFAYSGGHNLFQFYYKFEPENPNVDKAFVNVQMRNDGNVLNDFIMELSPSQTYTRAQLEISDLPEAPDSCQIFFIVGVSDTIDFTYNLGSVLYLDALSFENGVGVDNFRFEQVTDLVSPNPAESLIFIAPEILDQDIEWMEILDMNGRKLRHLVGSRESIDLSGMQSGLYLLRVATQDKLLLTKFEKH